MKDEYILPAGDAKSNHKGLLCSVWLGKAHRTIYKSNSIMQIYLYCAMKSMLIWRVMVSISIHTINYLGDEEDAFIITLLYWLEPIYIYQLCVCLIFIYFLHRGFKYMIFLFKVCFFKELQRPSFLTHRGKAKLIFLMHFYLITRT